jgi:hypothetical protein
MQQQDAGRKGFRRTLPTFFALSRVCRRSRCGERNNEKEEKEAKNRQLHGCYPRMSYSAAPQAGKRCDLSKWQKYIMSV